MNRSRGARAALATLLVVLAALVSAGQPTAAFGQTTGGAASPQTAGTATVSFDETWVFDPEGAEPSSVFLMHRDIPMVMFMYGEVRDPSITDANMAIDEFTTGFFGSFGDQNQQVVASDSHAQGGFWRLYAVSMDSIPLGMLVSASMTAVPGSVVVALLVAPEGSFDLAMTAVQDGIDVNGAGSPMDAFDATEISGLFQGGSPPPVSTETPTSTGGLTLPPLDPTPETGTTPDTTRGGLTLPPLDPTATAENQTTPPDSTGTTGQGQSLVVNTASVTYGPGWVYEEAISTPNEVAFFSNPSSQTTIFGYATVADASSDAALSLDQFNDGFFGTFGATNVQQVAREVLPSGRAYTLHTGDQGMTPVAILAYADVTTAPGEFRVQILIVAEPDFEGMLTSAMQSFQIDGAGAFSELDPAALVAVLAGGAATDPASNTIPDTSTTTQPGGSTLEVSGDISQFEAQDAQGTCDTIGWAVTAPDQMPASEADIDYRSVCVDGNVYFASCGLVPETDFGAPEPGMAWVLCDVTVRVDGAPLELTMFDFSLTDAAGTAYSFDILAGVSAIELISIFPETEIATGQTATGSVIFSVPVSAPGPWVLTVEPFALSTTGAQPGSLVISGTLQPMGPAAP